MSILKTAISRERFFGVVDKVLLAPPHLVSATGAAGATLPEDATPAWSASAPSGAYSSGYEVHRATTGWVYSRITTHSAVEATPPESANPGVWKAMRPTNRMAWADDYRSTVTRSTERLELVIRPQNLIDTLWLDSVQTSTLTVGITTGVGGPVVLPTTAQPMYETGLNWQTFFLQPVRPLESASWRELALVTDPVVTITLEAHGGVASIGNVVMGRFQPMGWTQYGPGMRRRRYGRWEEAADGTVTRLKRPGAGDTTVRVTVDPEDMDQNDYLIEKYGEVPTLWQASDGQTVRSLSRYGTFDGEQTWDSHGIANLTGTIRGMI